MLLSVLMVTDVQTKESKKQLSQIYLQAKLADGRKNVNKKGEKKFSYLIYKIASLSMMVRKTDTLS